MHDSTSHQFEPLSIVARMDHLAEDTRRWRRTLAGGSRLLALAMLVATLACDGTGGLLDPTNEVADLQLTPEDVTLIVGNSVVLSVQGLNSDGTPVEGDVTWTSSDPTVASVTETGLVTALKVGEASVEADFRGKGKAHGRKKKNSKVKVEPPPDSQRPPGEDPQLPPTDTIPPPPTDTIPPPPTDTIPPPPTDTVPPPPANEAPSASFSYDCTDLSCSFNASASSDSDGSIADYSWTFGDGQSGSGEAVSHDYTADGTYGVRLTVTDDDGATDSKTRDITVQAPPPPPPPPPPAGDGIPFGPSRFDVSSDYPFNASLYHRVHPGREESELSMLVTYDKRASVNMVGGKGNYKNPDESFNVEMWKAELDQFDVAIIQKYVDNGRIVAHYALDEPHAGSQWSGVDVDPALVDEAACYSKSKWPNLPVLIRTHPGWAVREEGAAHDFQCVDIWVAQYSSRKGPIDEYVAENVADAAALGAQLYGALNPITGGDGSSGVPSPVWDGKYMMSADEVRTYGEAWMNAPIAGFSAWYWGWGVPDPMDWYWEQPDIRAAVDYLVSIKP